MFKKKGKTDYVTVAGHMDKGKVHPRTAFHKSKPSSVPRGIVDSYSTLRHVGGGNSCGGHSLMRVAMTRWLTGLWSTQAKMEGLVLKAAWHWGRDCSVVNDPLGEPGRTPLYVGLPSAWSSVDGDQMFSLFFVGGLLVGDSDRYK